MSFQKVLNAEHPENIQKAVEILRGGGIVVFPTETVYGLGAEASNDKAVCRVFEVKQRPSFDPLILHVSSPEEAFTLWEKTPKIAETLARRFWPGPLTLVLPKSSNVSDLVTSGLPTVAVRMPRHDAALALIRALGSAIAAPSANVFGHTSPTSAAHVLEDLGEKVDLILDGGPCSVGLESTVLKIEKDGEGILLRPGGIALEELSRLLPIKKAAAAPKTVESPGQMESHYAPWTRLLLLPGRFGDFAAEFESAVKGSEAGERAVPRVGLLAFEHAPESAHLESVQVLSEKGDLVEAAANLFQAMRKLDKMHLDLILAEPVPGKGIGLAIADRLSKASGGRIARKETLC